MKRFLGNKINKIRRKRNTTNAPVKKNVSGLEKPISVREMQGCNTVYLDGKAIGQFKLTPDGSYFVETVEKKFLTDYQVVATSLIQLDYQESKAPHEQSSSRLLTGEPALED